MLPSDSLPKEEDNDGIDGATNPKILSDNGPRTSKTVLADGFKGWSNDICLPDDYFLIIRPVPGTSLVQFALPGQAEDRFLQTIIQKLDLAFHPSDVCITKTDFSIALTFLNVNQGDLWKSIHLRKTAR
jgi:hypothetical protein